MGNLRNLHAIRDPEVLVEGPAGTGKSRAILEKLDLVAWRYPNARILICRKTRSSLTESALVTFERDVMDPRHMSLKGPQRSGRTRYFYPETGSEILVAGVDNPTRILSTEFDLIYVQEATELHEEDWEVLSTRLRAGALPYQQIIADCNPDRAGHWLNRRCESGKTRRIKTKHQDNPVFWNHQRQQWTQAGQNYLDRLKNLSGARKLRLLEGQWASSEGLVYPEFDPQIHAVDRFLVPHSWTRIWVIDFGFTNPFVWQDWAIDREGTAYLVQEIYRTGRIVKDHAHQIRSVTLSEPNPVVIICDHDPEGIEVLRREFTHRILLASKSVGAGIQRVQERLQVKPGKRPRLNIMRDSLVEQDESLAEAHLPTSSLEEVEGYVWSPHQEAPVKKDDHGMDCWRYLCMYLDQSKPPAVAKSYSGTG